MVSSTAMGLMYRGGGGGGGGGGEGGGGGGGGGWGGGGVADIFHAVRFTPPRNCTTFNGNFPKAKRLTMLPIEKHR